MFDFDTDLLHIVNTSSQEISGDEYTGGSSSALIHDNVTSHLVYLTEYNADTEFVILPLISDLTVAAYWYCTR